MVNLAGERRGSRVLSAVRTPERHATAGKSRDTLKTARNSHAPCDLSASSRKFWSTRESRGTDSDQNLAREFARCPPWCARDEVPRPPLRPGPLLLAQHAARRQRASPGNSSSRAVHTGASTRQLLGLTISSSLLGWLAGRNLLIDRGASRVVEKRFRTRGGFPHTTLARAHVALNRPKIRRTRTPRRPRVCADVTTAARRRRDEDGRETRSRSRHRRPRYPADDSA